MPLRNSLSIVRLSGPTEGVRPRATAIHRSQIERGQRIFIENCAVMPWTVNGEGQPNWSKTLIPTARYPHPPLNGDGHTWHHGDGTLIQAGQILGGAYLGGVKGLAGLQIRHARFRRNALTHQEIIDVLDIRQESSGDRPNQYTWTTKRDASQPEVSENDPLSGQLRRIDFLIRTVVAGSDHDPENILFRTPHPLEAVLNDAIEWDDRRYEVLEHDFAIGYQFDPLLHISRCRGDRALDSPFGSDNLIESRIRPRPEWMPTSTVVPPRRVQLIAILWRHNRASRLDNDVCADSTSVTCRRFAPTRRCLQC